MKTWELNFILEKAGDAFRSNDGKITGKWEDRKEGLAFEVHLVLSSLKQWLWRLVSETGNYEQSQGLWKDIRVDI